MHETRSDFSTTSLQWPEKSRNYRVDNGFEESLHLFIITVHVLLPVEATLHHVREELLPRVCPGVRLLQCPLVCGNIKPKLTISRNTFQVQFRKLCRQSIDLRRLLRHLHETAQVEMNI